MSYLNKTAFTHLLGNDNLNALSLLDSVNQHMEKKAFGEVVKFLSGRKDTPPAQQPAVASNLAPNVPTPTTGQQPPLTWAQRWVDQDRFGSAVLGPVAVAQAGLQGIGQMMPGGSVKGLMHALRDIPQAGKNFFTSAAGALGAGEGVQNLVGKYALPALSIAALTALASGKKKKTQPAASAGAPVINIHNNSGDRRSRLLSDNPDVGSLSSYKYASFLSKKADMITDTLVNVAKNRVANKMLDKMVTKENKDDSEKSKNKEVELVSKNPKIKKLLDNEENKQYLEKLITEKA
jgi:hypothetical protein